MKLITAIVNKEDSKNVCNQLLKNKFYVTRLATTGGFSSAPRMRRSTTASASSPSAASSAPRSCPAPPHWVWASRAPCPWK